MPAHIAQYITIASKNPPLSVRALRGSAAPKATSSGGGWNEVPRPRRKSLTEFDGYPPFRVSVPLLLDGHAHGESVDGDCAELERMFRPPASPGEPPIVTVAGSVPHADLDYVIEALEWGDIVLYSRHGYRTRQDVIVRLLEYVAPDRVHVLTAAEQARQTATAKTAGQAKTTGTVNQPAHPKLYTVRPGDTLSAIAVRELGSYKRWTEIADLNGIRDPRAVAAGEVVRLP